jgi:bifunctional non-homologous end joining protein LigD
MTLTEYRRKRDFRKTPEPSGARKSAKGRLYVVQKHAASHLHYDFRLQLGDVLKSWAVPKGPSLDPRDKRLAMEVEDHPVDYGSFEGIIPKGEYGGGTVMLWDRGDWEPLEDASAGYRAGKLKFNLHGEKLRGMWTLVRRSATAGTSKPQWFLIKHRDEFARDHEQYNVTTEAPLSVATGRDLDEIAEERDRVWGRDGEVKQTRRRGTAGRANTAAAVDGAGVSLAKRVTAKSRASRTNEREAGAVVSVLSRTGHDEIPKFIEPELATLVKQSPVGNSWFHEIKFDGYRIVAFVEHDKVRCMTRNELDWTAKIPRLAEAMRRLKLRQAIFDGEIIVLDEHGISQFQLLQNAFRESPGKIIYAVFDLLFYNGHDLRDRPLEERKKLLESLKLPVDRGFIRYVEHVIGQGDKFLAAAAKQGLEGIVSKRRDGPYLSSRTRDWLKCKTRQRAEFVIGGFTDPDGARIGFGALLAGYHDQSGALHYAGRVGTGFTVKTIDELMRKLKPLVQKQSPFVDFPARGQSSKGVHWIEPRLVAQVEFSNWTGDKRLRHPSFQGLREDKAADEVTLEKPDATSVGARSKANVHRSRTGRASGRGAAAESNGRANASSSSDKVMIEGVELTHPDRVYYPAEGITKRELAEYYVACADRMLPHVAGRPLSLVRCPNGIEGERFFQKHLGPYAPKALRPIKIKEKVVVREYGVVDDAAGLVAIAQIGGLEIHVWDSREDRIENPDQLVFDLDPAPDVEWPRVIAAAEELREFLKELRLESFVKTSGGKGLHLVVPIDRRLEWPEVYDFCQRVAFAAERAAPDRYVATMSKKARAGKIFIDYQRNQRGATAVAAFSTRAKPGAPISMPISWRELRRAKNATQFKLREMMKRLTAERADPWDGFFDVRQSITAKAIKMLGE